VPTLHGALDLDLEPGCMSKAHETPPGCHKNQMTLGLVHFGRSKELAARKNYPWSAVYIYAQQCVALIGTSTLGQDRTELNRIESNRGAV